MSVIALCFCKTQLKQSFLTYVILKLATEIVTKLQADIEQALKVGRARLKEHQAAITQEVQPMEA